MKKKPIFCNNFFSIYSSQVNRKKTQKKYDVINLGRRVGVLFYHNDNVLLTKQYRFLINDYSWEISGGSINENETFREGALREAFEETGFEAKKLKRLLTFYPGLDNFDNETTIFTSEINKNNTNLNKFVPSINEIEEIKWFKIDTCLKMISKKKILDSMTITSLYAFKLMIVNN